MDHLEQAKFYLERAISTDWQNDVQALCGIGHALVALGELQQQRQADIKEAAQIMNAAILETEAATQAVLEAFKETDDE